MIELLRVLRCWLFGHRFERRPNFGNTEIYACPCGMRAVIEKAYR